MSRDAPPNPHLAGSDEHALWEICVRRDILSFAAADWSICAGDFDDAGFAGWDARFSPDPMRWRMAFPTLADYRAAWSGDARQFAARAWRIPLAEGLFSALKLARIEISGDTALVHKRFDGLLVPADDAPMPLHWQSLFHLRRSGGRWLQRGFVGYLPT